MIKFSLLTNGSPWQVNLPRHCAWVFAVFIGICAPDCFGQAAVPPVAGHWLGSLAMPNGGSLKIGINITQEQGTLKASLDVPDQGAMNLPGETPSVSQRHLRVEFPSIRAFFDGEIVDAGTIRGTFNQGGQAPALELKRIETGLAGPLRPQEPRHPFPYLEKEVQFTNQDAGIQLAGTLTLPRSGGPFPAVFLISGSGPNDRDEFIWGHRVFLVLSDWLTRQGIAVLRADDRGTGKSTGDYSKAGLNEFASDALAAVRFLKQQKEIDPKRIGLVGHSEGGVIAPVAAIRSSDVSFLVLMAGPAEPMSAAVDYQYRALFQSYGASEAAMAKYFRHQRRVYDILRQEQDNADAEKKISRSIDQLVKDLTPEETKQLHFNEAEERGGTAGLFSPEFRSMVNFDPTEALRKVKCPVLAINGSKDVQVEADKNLALMKEAFTRVGNSHATVKRLEGLNHLFQTAGDQADTHYERIEETMAPLALRTISEWIESETNRGGAQSQR